MSNDMSPESERFLQLVADVNAGIDQLERGEGEPLDVDAIKAKVAARLEQTKSKQRVERSPDAEHDLIEIGVYIAERRELKGAN